MFFVSAVRLDPKRASLLGRIGAHALHSRYDSRDLTAPARAAFLAKFLEQVDPHGDLPEAERLRRAEHARKEHFARLALRSAEARRGRKPKATAGAGAPAVNEGARNCGGHPPHRRC